MTTDPQATVTVLEQLVELRVTGQPDVKNRYGSGHIRPTEVSFRYRAGGVRAQVYGRWVRPGGELTDAPCSQDYTAHSGDMADWPGWLAELAREHQPAAPVVPPPATRADVRDRIAEALIRWSYRGQEPDPETGILETVRANAYSRADAVLAVLPPAADRAAVLNEAADALAALDPTSAPLVGYHARGEDIGLLRRLAGEEQPAEAHPTYHRWYTEQLDPVANQWAPGMRFTDRAEAVERYRTVSELYPNWRDGTPVERRLVRETTTYTVEAEHTPEATS